MRMNGLADALHNSKSGPTYQIGQLKKAGRVRRRRCSSDVRATYAALTDDDRRPGGKGRSTTYRQLAS